MLPVGSSRKLAFAFYDTDRGTLITRDDDVLLYALEAYVGGVIEDLRARDQSGEPRIVEIG